MFHKIVIVGRGWINKHPEILTLFFFIAILALGLFIYKDYGMHIDDPSHKILGEMAYDYIFYGNRTYLSNPDANHGVFIDLLLAIVNKTFNITSDPDIYFLRHLTTFITFYIGIVFFYFLCKKITGEWRLGLLGCLFLLISPRIFENAFLDLKDISTMSAAIISATTLLLFSYKQTGKTLIIHSLSSGLLIALRMPGMYIVVITIILWGFKLSGSRIGPF